MTKHSLHDEALKAPLSIDDVKVGVASKLVEDSLVIRAPDISGKAKSKMEVAVATQKAQVRRVSRLCKATQDLYDLEGAHAPEKPLNIDLGLYQMEDY